MCGITGFWKPKNNSVDLKSTLQSMTGVIAHRGPDGEGFWMDESLGIAFGHRRLAIQDLSPAGFQPMESASKRYIICFNGEVYNGDDLKNELPSQGYRGHSDTEVMLAAIETWGLEKAVSKFIGMFAFALYDRQKKTLSLVRDRVGVKPLYWGIENNTLLFGSELKSLKAHPHFQGTLNLEALGYFFQMNYIPAPHTIYRGIFKQTPGTILTFDQDLSHKSQTYWSLDESIAHGQANPTNDYKAYVDQTHTLLRDCIKRRMISDVPLGAFLSGGVDSSLVVALMQEASSSPVKTFTIGFNEPSYNEAPYAKAVSEHLGTDHREFYMPIDEAASLIPQLPDMFDEPFADSSQIPTYLVSRMAREHVTVSLSGDGGDELFAGYNRYHFTQKYWSKLAPIPLGLRKALAPLLKAIPKGLLNAMGPMIGQQHFDHKIQKVIDILPSTHIGEFYANLNSYWGKTSPLLNPQGAFAYNDFQGKLSGVQYLQALDFLYYLPEDIMTKVDRSSMATSLEAREPLLDHRLIELAWRAPTDFNLSNGQTKRPLRDILYQYVPKELIERPKMGFGIPIDQWLRKGLRPWAEELLDPAQIKADGILNGDVIQERWNAHKNGQFDWQYSLWGVLMFQAWKERWM